MNTKELKILEEVQNKLKISMDYDDSNRINALDDLEFIGIEGAQWPEDVKNQRLAENRPCLTIDKMSSFINQVVGDQRMNSPAIKVIPVNSDGDINIAQILNGWVMHVMKGKGVDAAIDHGFEHAVACGYGAIRVVTKYIDNTSFNQDAYIQKIDNALAVYWGKHSEYDCSDANYCILITDVDKEEYKDKYKEEPMSFNGDAYVNGWVTKDTVRLAEYFVKKRLNNTIYLLDDGRIVKSIMKGDVVKKKRVTDEYKILRYLVSGDKVLESQEWAGRKYIPIIPIWGEELNVGGKSVIRGLIRKAKDSQRMYNYWSSLDTEVITMQPRSPYLVTPKQISGHEAQWNSANKKNYPYLLVNHDPSAPAWPKRQSPPLASGAMVERLRATDQEMRDTIGLQKASLGIQGNERSGKAILERKKEGDVGTFSFIDNLSRSIEHLGRVLIDVAPRILDTERVIRLGLADGSQKFVGINQEVIKNGVSQIINDPSVGEYDVEVTIGPSFSTQRTEAKDSMAQFIQYYPAAAPIIGDLYAKAMDWPGAAEVSKRLEVLLPPQVKEEIAQEKAKNDGEQVPQPQPSQNELMAAEIEKINLQKEQISLQSEQVNFNQQKVELEQSTVKLEQEKVKLLQMKGGENNNAVI